MNTEKINRQQEFGASMTRRDHKAAAKQRVKTIKKMMVDTETTPADLAEEMGLKLRTVHKLLRCERTTERRYNQMEQILTEYIHNNTSQSA